MTQRHRKRTQHGPSLLSVVAGTVLSVVLTATTFWTVSGEEITSHHLAGMAGCTLLTTLVLSSTITRGIDWAEMRGQRKDRERAAQRLRDANTGSWISPDSERMTVRRDGRRAFVIDPDSGAEIEWTDRAWLGLTIGDLEATGWARLDDDATRGVCEWLGLPGEVDSPGEKTVPGSTTTASRSPRPSAPRGWTLRPRWCAMAGRQKDAVWTMPRWMESYRALIGDTGGSTVEDLVNDRTTTFFSNAIRAALITSVQGQVALMYRLHKRGQLIGPGDPDWLDGKAPRNAPRVP